ncbi:UDP-glucose 4-epimerase GalE [Candidatus Microgenomates bacterium]|nr:UDP-glucose 4-epimerase GalE [Candidatus Microgenomates bacterium]
MKILVTGGAGYIGSHMVAQLIKSSATPVVFDNLSSGHKEAIPVHTTFVKGDLEDSELLAKLFEEENFDAVMHFAAFISMAESVENPKIYFRNNSFNALNLLDMMVRFNVKNFIFSSTAGVYGNPIKVPITEDHLCHPTNPYGESKLMVERMLRWYDQAYGLKSVILRYFNAAGASLDGKNGESHDPETHIIPMAIKTALGQNEYFEIFGTDYHTLDGTCIRDYIHVIDLVQAHILALDKLMNEKKSLVYNVGTGKGYSNKEIAEAVKKVSGVDFAVEYSQRRPGDASELVAAADKIKKELNWEPKYSDLETIVSTAWQWHKNNPLGFYSAL